MCGGYTIRLSPGQFLHFEDSPSTAWKPIYNARPGEILPIVTQEHPRTLTMAVWDFRPHWATRTRMQGVINARSESLVDKPYFRESVQKYRCSIPADGFYEWKKIGKTRQPYFFHRKDGKQFHFAGIYDRQPTDPTRLGFAIITTRPNSDVSAIHDRMPVILSERDLGYWLGSATPQEKVLSLFVPYHDSTLVYYPVSQLVNNVRNKGAEVLNPADTATESH